MIIIILNTEEYVIKKTLFDLSIHKDYHKTIKTNDVFNSNYIQYYLLVIHFLHIVHLIKNKLECYSCKDCMERFCKDLKEHATKIINYSKDKEKNNK